MGKKQYKIKDNSIKLFGNNNNSSNNDNDVKV